VVELGMPMVDLARKTGNFSISSGKITGFPLSRELQNGIPRVIPAKGGTYRLEALHYCLNLLRRYEN